MADMPKPYKVRTDSGTLVSEHVTVEQANSDAAARNARAEALEIKARYVASEQR